VYNEFPYAYGRVGKGIFEALTIEFGERM